MYSVPWWLGPSPCRDKTESPIVYLNKSRLKETGLSSERVSSFTPASLFRVESPYVTSELNMFTAETKGGINRQYNETTESFIRRIAIALKQCKGIVFYVLFFVFLTVVQLENCLLGHRHETVKRRDNWLQRLQFLKVSVKLFIPDI